MQKDKIYTDGGRTQRRLQDQWTRFPKKCQRRLEVKQAEGVSWKNKC